MLDVIRTQFLSRTFSYVSENRSSEQLKAEYLSLMIQQVKDDESRKKRMMALVEKNVEDGKAWQKRKMEMEEELHRLRKAVLEGELKRVEGSGG